MVSSKCFQVESPSPFRFFAALMPPCAQTEWERLTGTIENKSTGTPDSATRIVAIRPAKPPPTTMILGCVIERSHQEETKRSESRERPQFPRECNRRPPARQTIQRHVAL